MCREVFAMRRSILRGIHLRKLSFAALMLAAWPGASNANTSVQVEMECPYDGTRFTATLQASGTSAGMRLDFRPVGAIASPSPLAVCPTNGFVFFKDKFSSDELEKLRPLVL